LDVASFPDSIFLIMEYIEANMKAMIDDLHRPVSDIIVRYYVRQLFCGVSYLHSINIMHRDIKPENIMISNTGILKLIDFGQSCLYCPNNEHIGYEHQVASRWYRAPELLFGSCKYTPKVDTWACGCVLAELLNGSPLFPGRSDLEQIGLIMNVLGTPSIDSWNDLHTLPDSGKIHFESVPPVNCWFKVVPFASTECLLLLRHLIVYCPEERMSADDALAHDFFTSKSPEKPPYIPSNIKHSATIHDVDDILNFFKNTP
uniref:Protein kinase domain-containing protein n=1 Tax=Dracunculus medinensis TaxID=318479 RepID=A0A0N4U4Y4_DRAME